MVRFVATDGDTAWTVDAETRDDAVEVIENSLLKAASKTDKPMNAQWFLCELVCAVRVSTPSMVEIIDAEDL